MNNKNTKYHCTSFVVTRPQLSRGLYSLCVTYCRVLSKRLFVDRRRHLVFP
ncbi:unnamed protein product [Amoebophrya sp. A25]|nr:unnamed protein product [Amoebophrya sp. A25]|eukprot:GSA25T00008413001.1